VEGKRVIVVDDSVVSGITIKELSRRLKRAGALEVHFRIATPTVKTNCVYNSPAFPIRSGDFVDAEKLKEEICADPSQSLEFLPVEDLLNALKSPCPEADGFCTKCIE
jgi:amidophosphoribosyltransferase